MRRRYDGEAIGMPPPMLSTLLVVTGFASANSVFSSVVSLPPGPQFSAAQKKAQRELGSRLVAHITAAYSSGAAVVTVPAGNYRWAPPAAAADVWPLVLDSLIRPPEDPFTILAYGVTLWFDTRNSGLDPAPHVTRGLRLINCSNVVLKGFVTDFDPPNTIEGRVMAIDRGGNRLQLELSAGSKFRPPPAAVTADPNVGRFIPYKSDGEFITPLYKFQSSRGLRLSDWSMIDNTTQRFWASLETTELLATTGEAAWRELYGSAGILEEGDAVAIMYAVGSAVEVLNSEAVSIIEWHNYAAKTGFAETLGVGGHRFESLVFGKRPGTNRLMGGEGVMSNACRKGSRWRNISISLTTDDLFNFHGYWGYVMQVCGHQVAFHYDCLRPGCFTARSTGAVRIGDRVIWRHNGTMEVVGRSTVTKIINATLLEFDNDVEEFGPNLVAEFPDTGNSGWSIRDSRFFDAYQRLFVQSGPGEIVNNTFTRVGSSISIRSTVRTLSFLCLRIQMLSTWK